MLRALLLLIGALGVLTLGAAPAVASAPPPCRGDSHQSPTSPDKPVKAMSCCVACVVVAVPRPAEPVRIRPAPTVRPLPLATGRTGRRPAPDPGPPRLKAA